MANGLRFHQSIHQQQQKCIKEGNHFPPKKNHYDEEMCLKD
jgi:hypothetical protein